MCANLMCVAFATFTNVWGSVMALRGQVIPLSPVLKRVKLWLFPKDGAMGRAIDGMSRERRTIFTCFAVGLMSNLLRSLQFALFRFCVLTLICVCTQHFRSHNNSHGTPCCSYSVYFCPVYHHYCNTKCETGAWKVWSQRFCALWWPQTFWATTSQRAGDDEKYIMAVCKGIAAVIFSLAWWSLVDDY